MEIPPQITPFSISIDANGQAILRTAKDRRNQRPAWTATAVTAPPIPEITAETPWLAMRLTFPLVWCHSLC